MTKPTNRERADFLNSNMPHTLAAELAVAWDERDILAAALVVANDCLNGHMLGLNCRGPVIPYARFEKFMEAVAMARALSK